jgi:hypothetical protein
VTGKSRTWARAIEHYPQLGLFFSVERDGQQDITCNECGLILKTVPTSDLTRTLDEMQLALAVGSETCPHCRSVICFPASIRFWLHLPGVREERQGGEEKTENFRRAARYPFMTYLERSHAELCGAHFSLRRPSLHFVASWKA